MKSHSDKTRLAEIRAIMGKPDPYNDSEFQSSFSEWLDSNNDALPEPESFSDWLSRNNDSVYG